MAIQRMMLCGISGGAVDMGDTEGGHAGGNVQVLQVGEHCDGREKGLRWEP